MAPPQNEQLGSGDEVFPETEHDPRMWRRVQKDDGEARRKACAIQVYLP